MFSKKIINTLIRIHACSAITILVFGVAWGAWEAGKVNDFSDAMVGFTMILIMTALYCSFWYILMAVLYKYINK